MARQADRGDAIRVPVENATERVQEILETFRGQIKPRPQHSQVRQWMKEKNVFLKDLKLGSR